jgi:filamentous hemagglutinin
MGTGYTRKDTANNIADGNVINASDFDAEFDGLVSAFATSTGHTHDGNTGEGGPISKIGPSLQYEADANAFFPETNNAVDLGKTAKQFKDLYIDGVINADSVSADAVTVTNALSAESTLKVGGAATLESTLAVSATSAFKGAVSVESTLAVTSESKLQNVSATGTLNVDNNTTLGGNFSVSATATFSNNIFASADLIVASGLEVGAVSTFSAKTTFTTDATVGGTFAVGGTTNLATATVSGTIDVSGNASVGGTHTVDGDLKNTSGNLTVDPATQILEIKGSGSTEGQIQLNCAVNSHGQIITAADHGVSATNTLTLPGGDTIGNANATLVSDTGTQTLTNKTLTSPAINGATIDSAVSVSSAGTLNAGTNADIQGTLNVAGSAGLAGNVNLGNATADSVVVGGVLTANASANLTGNVGVGGTIIGASTISDSKGDIRDLDVSRTVAATAEIALTDLGQMVQLNSAGVQALIPSASNMTGAFSIGDIVSIVNTTSTTGSITSQITSFVGGAVSATGTITLGANGIANIYFVSADGCIITGNVS